LLGPKGAGKRTTVKMLTTLLPLTSGSAQVAGYEVDALRSMMLTASPSANGLGVDFAVVVAGTTALVALAAHLYPRVAQ
jgi:ABC-2 type transport system ATP-binding protein